MVPAPKGLPKVLKIEPEPHLRFDTLNRAPHFDELREPPPPREARDLRQSSPGGGGGKSPSPLHLRGTTTETDRETYTPTVTLPPYAVILHNDDHSEMGYVVSALLKSVSSLSREDAVRIMLEAHNAGLAVVIVCPLEQAELYRDRLRSFNLGVTIEKA